MLLICIEERQECEDLYSVVCLCLLVAWNDTVYVKYTENALTGFYFYLIHITTIYQFSLVFSLT